MHSDTLFKIIRFSTESFSRSILPSRFDFSNINSYKIETSFKLHFQSSQNLSNVIAVPQLITFWFQILKYMQHLSLHLWIYNS